MSSISSVPSGTDATEYGPLRGVAVGRGEAYDVVLTGAMGHGLRSASRSVFARGLVADAPRPSPSSRATSVAPSVALIALFEPRVAAVVIAVAFPESGLVVVEQVQTATNFALFQK